MRKQAVIRLDKGDLKTLKADLKEYIMAEEDPNIPKFISKYKEKLPNITRQYIEGNKELSGLVEWALLKEEAFLLDKKKEIPMAIFRLKQPKFGYTDTPQTGVNVQVNFTNSVPRPKKQIENK